MERENKEKELKKARKEMSSLLENYVEAAEKLAIIFFDAFAKDNPDITFDEFMNFLNCHFHKRATSQSSIEILKIIVSREMANKKISPVETDDK